MGKNRTWMYAALALGGGFLGGLAALELAPAAAEAAHGVRSISTHELVLVDNEGTQRARLSVSTSGMADLEMMDGQGRDRAELRVSDNGVSTLGFYDSKGARRVLIGAAPGQRSGITVYGSRDRIVAGLTVNSNNESSLTLYDPNTGRAR